VSAAGGGSTAPATGQPSGPVFTNPVYGVDFPDPFVTRVGDEYYAYATGKEGQNLQAARSDDLAKWTALPDPLPELPAWAGADATWAPEVYEIAGGYVMYYTVRHRTVTRVDGAPSQCISVAVADAPRGPFVDSSNEPLVCEPELGGSIDATLFTDADGARYLIWKTDGNCCALPVHFRIQRVSEDGLELEGESADLGLKNDQPWEGNVIEAPTLLLVEDTYYLFYSGNSYETELYSVGYATSDVVTGPYTDATENPILAIAWGRPDETTAAGPGHQSIVSDDEGDLWIAYHAWDENAIGYPNLGARTLWLDRLEFENGRPVVLGPTDEPQPVP
jgi:beta-xylosidase